MHDPQFDEIVERASSPYVIPGIYNYCDHRCERCRFANRCFQHIETTRQTDAPPDSVESVAHIMTRSLDQTMHMLRVAADRLGVDLSVEAPATSAQIKEGCEAFEGAMNDPLVVKSRDYTCTVWPVARALRPVLQARGDPLVVEALDTIESLCLKVSSKTFRAVSSASGAWDDPTDQQSDSNGSAKVARLLIAESRRAWRVMMEAGRASADGLPARLIQLLDELDKEIAARFPQAMLFIRPGFDTEPVTTSVA